MYIITKDGCNGREISSNEVVGENVAYDNHWIKMRGYIPEQGYAWKLMNVDTGHTYSMPYNEFSSWYYGNDKYYALSLEGSLYNICYENRIISTQKYKFVNFTNDKILIAGDLNGECIFMDYSLNEKLRAKDASVYWNGKAVPADGVVTGYGVVNSNLVYIYSQDVTALNGSVGEMHAKKIAGIYEMAMKAGAPVIGLIDCAGIRVQEAMDALAGFGDIYMAKVNASGVIPQISAVLGSCGGRR